MLSGKERGLRPGRLRREFAGLQIISVTSLCVCPLNGMPFSKLFNPIAGIALSLTAITTTIACGTDPGRTFAQSVENAAGKTAYLKHAAVAANIHLRFGGKDRVVGTMIFETAGDRSRIDFQDGSVMLFDGREAVVSPPDHPAKKPRFELLTWPYFFELAFKLSDPGARLQAQGDRDSDGRTFPTARLSFGKSIGDTPDDWYILYQDPTTGLLDTAGYIVTYGQSVAEGEQEPHAIVYSEYVDVGGAKVATDWKFYLWTEERGIFGQPIGAATLSEIRYEQVTDQTFARPEEYRVDELPGS